MSPDVMLTIIKIVAVFVVVSFVVFWVGLVWWVSQDVLTRTKDKIIVSAAVALTAILGPVGILIYLVVRPRQTLKERFGEMMEQEMMLQASAITICPNCDHMAQEDFLACPYCGTVLKKACLNCEKLLAMDWDHCPFCNTHQNSTQNDTIVEQITVDSSGNISAIDVVTTPRLSLSQRLRPLANAWSSFMTPPQRLNTEIEIVDEPSINDVVQPATKSKPLHAAPVKKSKPTQPKHKAAGRKKKDGSSGSKH